MNPLTGTKEGRLIVEEGVLELEPYAVAEQRELQEVILPSTLQKVGRHAFYNCRGLRRLSFFDTLKDFGDGAFKNCEALQELVITRIPDGNLAGMKSILQELSGAFYVTFAGDEQMTEESMLYFPSYMHDYEENNEARIINQITYGIGVHYRECVRDSGVDYVAYDKVFAKCIHLDEDAAWRVALLRLLYPTELREEAEAGYRTWLHENRVQVLDKLSDNGELRDVRNWLSIEPYCEEREWTQAIDLMHAKGKWEAVSLLLQERQKRYGEQRNKFAFDA